MFNSGYQRLARVTRKAGITLVFFGQLLTLLVLLCDVENFIFISSLSSLFQTVFLNRSSPELYSSAEPYALRFVRVHTVFLTASERAIIELTRIPRIFGVLIPTFQLLAQ